MVNEPYKRDVSRRTVLRKGALATGAVVLGGVASVGTGGASAVGNAGTQKGQLQRELARAVSATSRYQKAAKAETDGFGQASPFICEMGYHYVNPSRVDGGLNISKPEALVYGEASNGKLMLGAVEYIIPTELHPSEPNLFSDEGVDLKTSESHGWHVESLPFGEAWTLHAWVHRPNPEGVFHPTNPTEPFATDQNGECVEE